MNYELERALRDKVEMWQFHALQSEVTRLKQENSQLSDKIDSLQNRFQNYYTALNQLIQLLSETDMPAEEKNFEQIRQYL